MNISDVIENTARKTARSVVAEMKRKDLVKSKRLEQFQKNRKGVV